MLVVGCPMDSDSSSSDTTASTIISTQVETSKNITNIAILFSEKIVFGSTVGTVLERVNGSIGIHTPSGFMIDTGTTNSLGTSQQVYSANFNPNSDYPTLDTLVLSINSELTIGSWIQITFGEDTIFDLTGNAVAKDTKSNKIQLSASP